MTMLPEEIVNQKIFLIRGYKVMLDIDLAVLYQVETGALNRAVKRNLDRFPKDFMFQLSKGEFENLKLQFGISKWGGGRYLPYAFTEHGVTMLASVLNSDRATQMSLFIVRAFIKMREMLSTHKDLANKIEEIERKQKEHGDLLASVYSVVKQLINEPVKEKGQFGFRVKDDE